MTASHVKRLCFWLLMALFAGLMLLWMLHVPYRPERLFRAIPGNAALISVHDSLAERWPEISKNTLLMSLLAACGVDLETQAMMAADRDFQYWFRRLTPDRAVIAYVPSFFRQGQEAWVVASWLGGDSQQLRWLLTWTRRHPCRKEGRHHGHILWSMETEEGQPSFRFAVVEGGVIGVLCEDPAALNALLDMYDGRIPGAAALVQSLADEAAQANPPARDFGIYATEPLPLRYCLQDVSPGRMALSLAVPFSIQTSSAWIAEDQFRELGKIIGEIPMATLLLSRGALKAALEHPLAAADTAAIRPWLDRLGGDALMLCVLGGDYSGRIKGIKWPALLAGVPAGGNRDVRATVQGILDELNRAYQWGLILREVPQGEQPSVYIIESTAGNAYSKFSLQEQLAFTLRGGWLLLASNAGTLMKICGHYGRGEEEEAEALWEQPAESDAALCRMNLAEGGKIVKTALTAYSMKLLFSDPDETQAERQRINEYKAWIDTLSPFEILKIKVQTGEQLNILISLGAVE